MRAEREAEAVARRGAQGSGRNGSAGRGRNGTAGRGRNGASVRGGSGSGGSGGLASGGGWWWAAAGLAGAALLGTRLKPMLRERVRQLVRAAGDKLLSESYSENLWEFASVSRRVGSHIIVEGSLRAEYGTAVQRPMGSARRWPDLQHLVFDVAQLANPPAEHDAPVDLAVALGPRAERPLRIDIPIMISGMAYGQALSERVKVALARGATLAGTATNTGEGPLSPMERQAASKLVVQFNRSTWGKTRRALQQADMIEIQFGQGAAAGVGGEVFKTRADNELRAMLDVAPGVPAISYSIHPELRDKPLQQLVDELRELGRGVPVAAKLAPGRRLEEDIQVCLDAGIDVIVLDGAQAATKGSPTIIQDDFGLPTLHGLLRAVAYLEKVKKRERVSLVVSGGLRTPGDFLKMVALGADAVYIGTMALFAVAHGQVFKSLPWEPPTQLVFYGGKQADEFDVDEGADRMARFLRGSAEEMAVALRALGKTSLGDLSRDDLMALDEHTAQVCSVPVSYRAP